MTGSRARPLTALAFLTLLSLSLAGCRQDITEVALVVQSDLAVPADVDLVEVASIAGPFAPSLNFSGGEIPVAGFPLSVGFESGGMTGTFSITVRLFSGSALIVSRTVTDIRFVPEQTMMLVVPMNRACACHGTSCPSDGDPACDNIDHPTLQAFDAAVAPPSSTLGGGVTGVGGPTPAPPRQGIDAM